MELGDEQLSGRHLARTQNHYDYRSVIVGIFTMVDRK